MKAVSSWGRLNAPLHHTVSLANPNEALKAVCNSASPGLAYGMGRSYGDACLNPDGTLWFASGLDHLIAFDEQTGVLVCEAGVLLRDIQRLMVPRGWMLPVTPGTQLVTVGGAIANDVHGKNHHVMGTFGEHVRGLTLYRTDGEVIQCGVNEKSDWLEATIGGLGLTGLIVQAELQLRPVDGPWLETDMLPYETPSDFFHLSDQSEDEWEHTVSWIDCVTKGGGRGLFSRANATSFDQGKSAPKTRALQMPLTPPISLVNRLSLTAFNALYFNLKKRQSGRKIEHYEPFFYPLDNLLEWNRMYGPKGFYQYQSVVPHHVREDAVKAMLKEISKNGDGSFLAVLKTFGDRPSKGMMSFPQAGVTLALDFPNKGKPTQTLFERLNAIVQEAKGRIYLAKDALVPRALFEAGYPRLSEFLNYRDPGISSGLSRRLMGD